MQEGEYRGFLALKGCLQTRYKFATKRVLVWNVSCYDLIYYEPCAAGESGEVCCTFS